jgi:endonuclease/exonuclease/phosphatase (EEP) superfamily protein YafD
MGERDTIMTSRSAPWKRLPPWTLAALVVVGLIGHLVRDRSIALGLLMFLPTPLLGLISLIVDLSLGGRALSLGRPRFGLSALGIVGMIVVGTPLVFSGGRPNDARDLALLHWNVQWGGGPLRSDATWLAQCQAILDAKADVVVLSEAPDKNWVDRLGARLGQGWSHALIVSDPRSPHWFRVAVLARGTVRCECLASLPNGSAAICVVETRGRSLRLLVVDGVSNPFRSRNPFLSAVDALRAASDTQGKPIDLLVGDFNAPSRCLGFDDFQHEGFRLASKAGGPVPQWRATYPASLPVLDIDHVWLSRNWEPRSCQISKAPWSDHRSQVARFRERIVTEHRP